MESSGTETVVQEKAEEKEVKSLPNSKKTDIEFNKPTLSREDLKMVLECLVEDQLSTGAMVEKFERAFAHTFRLKNSLSTNNLTSAYHLSLMALGVEEGDSVALSTFAPLAALDALFLLRAKPVVIDLKKFSFHMDPEKLKDALAANPCKAVIVDHAFGSAVDFSEYDFAGVPTIEDFSEVVGVEAEKFTPGKQGNISVCGLTVDHLITTGNGALLLIQDKKISEILKSLKDGDRKTRPRLDYNLIDYQAALGIEQLSKIGIILERKRKIAQVYLQSLSGTPVETYYGDPSVDSFNRFIILAPGKYEEVERYFRSLHIGTRRVIEEPIHQILELPNSDFPNGERIFQRGHAIPIYPNLTRDNIQRIANSVRRIY